jgi:hypothetical protein
MATPDLSAIRRLFADAGCHRLLAKPLAENDNSKNQVYFGPDFVALNLIPNRGVRPDGGNKTLKAALDFEWLDAEGGRHPAPRAQLVLYPQYPEVRFSGFLLGCRGGPNAVMAPRLLNRVLFLGLRADGGVLGHVVRASAQWIEAVARRAAGMVGVFHDFPVGKEVHGLAAKPLLVEKLGKIHGKGWIDSRKLTTDGQSEPCNAPNCGGFTLEAELGIRPNSNPAGDYLGWELKQHAVTDFGRMASGAVTLMTPEPTEGYYSDKGVERFIRKYGYADQRRSDRLNFGGIHKVGAPCSATGLTLSLDGFKACDWRKTDIKRGGIELVSSAGVVAARWPFQALMEHWQRKHALATYIPSIVREQPKRQYAYGHTVHMGEGTDFFLLLRALSAGDVYYDPGIKLEAASSTAPRLKRRSQFRIQFKRLGILYRRYEAVGVASR